MADGLGQHIPKGYVYFAMAFSLGVELLNLKLRARQSPVKLHGRLDAEQEELRRRYSEEYLDGRRTVFSNLLFVKE